MKKKSMANPAKFTRKFTGCTKDGELTVLGFYPESIASGILSAFSAAFIIGEMILAIWARAGYADDQYMLRHLWQTLPFVALFDSLYPWDLVVTIVVSCLSVGWFIGAIYNRKNWRTKNAQAKSFSFLVLVFGAFLSFIAFDPEGAQRILVVLFPISSAIPVLVLKKTRMK